MQHRPVRSGRYIVLIGLAAALVCGICGSNRFSWSKPKPSNAPDLRSLDRQAQPYFDAATSKVPGVVRQLTTTGTLWRLCWLMAKDRLGGTQCADTYLEQVLQPIIENCRRGAKVYGCGIPSGGFARSISDVTRYHTTGVGYALGGLALEAMLVKPTLVSLRAVLGATVARLAAAYGGGAAAAAADGPLPVGDLIGIATAAGGTAWCLYDLVAAKKQLPRDLTAALYQAINECRESCRREVLK